MREYFKEASEKLFPVFCVLCLRKGRKVCSSCLEEISLSKKTVICSSCSERVSSLGLLCSQCSESFGNMKLDILFDTSSQILKLVEGCIAGSREIMHLISNKIIDLIVDAGVIPDSIAMLSSKRFTSDWIFELGKILSKHFAIKSRNLRILEVEKFLRNEPQLGLVIGESFFLFISKHRNQLCRLSKNTLRMVFIH